MSSFQTFECRCHPSEHLNSECCHYNRLNSECHLSKHFTSECHPSKHLNSECHHSKHLNSECHHPKNLNFEFHHSKHLNSGCHHSKNLNSECHHSKHLNYKCFIVLFQVGLSLAPSCCRWRLMSLHFRFLFGTPLNPKLGFPWLLIPKQSLEFHSCFDSLLLSILCTYQTIWNFSRWQHCHWC